MTTMTKTPEMIIRKVAAKKLGWAPSAVLPFTGLTLPQTQSIMAKLKPLGLEFPSQLHGIKCVNDLYRTQEKLKGDLQ